jgi:glycosyltransferase involved in cell wall biosynthesis
MRIFFDARMADQQHLHGIARFLANLIDWGKKHRPQHQIVVGARNPQRWSDFEVIGLKAPPFHWREHSDLYRALSRQKFDRVFFPSLAGPLWSPQPYWMTVHDLIPWHYPSSPLVKLYVALVGRWLTRRAGRLFCGSQFTKGQLVEILGCRAEKITVIPYGGLDGTALELGQSSPRLLEGDYFLCVTNPRPHKNLATLLEAFQGLEGRCQLAVVCPPCPQLEPLPAGVVAFRGISDQELRGLYQHARAAVVPSHLEGFGLPALEAMQLGTPVLSARAASLPEVVGEAGLYFDQRSPESIRNCLNTFLDLPNHEEMRHRALAQSSKFSWDLCCEAFWEAFESTGA